MANAESGRIDGLKLLKENPGRLKSALLDREKVIISILGEKGGVMVVDRIKDRYINKVLENLIANMRLFSTLGKLVTAMNATEKTADDDLRAITALLPGEDAFLEMLNRLGNLAGDTAERALGIAYHTLFPDRRKVPLLIGGYTVQKMLDGLAGAYVHVVETRELADKRASRGYYLNSDFYADWLEQGGKAMADAIRNPFLEHAEYDATFYGIESRIAMAQAGKLIPILHFAISALDARNFEALGELEKMIKDAVGPGCIIADSAGKKHINIDAHLTDEAELELLEAVLRPKNAKNGQKKTGEKTRNP